MRTLRLWLVCLSLACISGCASLPAGHVTHPNDPWERYNRAVFSFNSELDRAVVKPLAQGYEKYIPELFQSMVRNFFGNLSDLVSSVHHALQAEPSQAASAGGRFLVNTTLGFLGIADPASDFGLEKSNEDFGLTFGVWGADAGPYLVLPLLGPSSVRDGLGRFVDLATDPFSSLFDPTPSAQNATTGLRLISTRAALLSLEPAFDLMAFDRYQSVRDAYLARRAQLVNPDASLEEYLEE